MYTNSIQMMVLNRTPNTHTRDVQLPHFMKGLWKIEVSHQCPHYADCTCYVIVIIIIIIIVVIM